MDTFFNPRSVAVIGASNSPFNLGATICRCMNEYSKWDGTVYAVNRKGEDVFGCKGCRAVTDIEGDVDLAVIITPAGVVPDFVEQCAAKGIRRIIIESSGFSEGGEEGRALQRRIDETAREHGLRIMGPNCLGVLNAANGFSCFYGVQPDNHHEFLGSESGSVSFIIQSGGIVVIVLESFLMDVVKANKIVSIGNKSDIDEADMLKYFEQDDSTQVVAMYLENIKQGRKFIETARKMKKPVLVFKVGRTSEGARAAMSHTAGMANNDAVFDMACRQAGVIRVNAISELHSLPKMFTHMPPLKGRRIAVFTNSGAFGGITADLIVESGLEMAVFPEETKERLRSTAKLFNVSNPVDLGPTLGKQTFIDIWDAILSSDTVDGLLAVPNVWMKVVVEAICELGEICKKYDKPAAIYIPNAIERILAIRTEFNLPVFESPEEATRALTVSYEHYRALGKKAGEPLPV